MARRGTGRAAFEPESRTGAAAGGRLHAARDSWCAEAQRRAAQPRSEGLTRYQLQHLGADPVRKKKHVRGKHIKRGVPRCPSFPSPELALSRQRQWRTSASFSSHRCASPAAARCPGLAGCTRSAPQRPACPAGLARGSPPNIVHRGRRRVSSIGWARCWWGEEA